MRYGGSENDSDFDISDREPAGSEMDSSDPDAVPHQLRSRPHNEANGHVKKRPRFPSNGMVEESGRTDPMTLAFNELVRLKRSPAYRHETWIDRFSPGVWNQIHDAIPNPKPSKDKLYKTYRILRRDYFLLESIIASEKFVWDYEAHMPKSVDRTREGEDKAWKELYIVSIEAVTALETTTNCACSLLS